MRHANAAICVSLRTAALVVLTALVGQVRAQTASPVQLEWSAPSDCPTAPEVLARIRKLAHDWSKEGMLLRAEATITRNSDRELRLRLIVRAGDLVGERNIAAKSCANLANATAIHVALLLNQVTALDARDLSAQAPPPGAAGDAAPPPSVANDATPAAAKSEPAPASEESDRGSEPAETPRPTTRSWRFLLQLPLASLQLGPLPKPSFGVSLAAGVRIGSLRVLADGGVRLQQRFEREGQPEVGADIDHIHAGVRACHALARNAFELAPCLRISVEHIWARGTGAEVTPRTAEATWIAFGAGVQVRLYLLDWVGLLGGVDVQLEGARPRISVDGLGSLGKLGPASVAFTLGSEWIF